MTNKQHPITPPTHLVERWRAAASNIPASLCSDPGGRRDYIDYIVAQASQWAADAELDACCQYISNEGEWFAVPGHRLAELRAARRPKPPSLKEQALAELRELPIDPELGVRASALDTIRRALEALPE